MSLYIKRYTVMRSCFQPRNSQKLMDIYTWNPMANKKGQLSPSFFRFFQGFAMNVP